MYFQRGHAPLPALRRRALGFPGHADALQLLVPREPERRRHAVVRGRPAPRPGRGRGRGRDRGRGRCCGFGRGRCRGRGYERSSMMRCRSSMNSAACLAFTTGGIRSAARHCGGVNKDQGPGVVGSSVVSCALCYDIVVGTRLATTTSSSMIHRHP